MLCGCGRQDDAGTTDAQHGGAVCHLVDRDLVSAVVGDGKLSTTGPGAVSAGARTAAVSHCSIRADDAREPVVQVRLGDTGGEADTWRTRLKGEADEAGVPLTYEDDDWYGYTRDYPSGMYNPGSSLDVVTDDHVIRVTIYTWSGSTHDQRVALAEKIARSAVDNQATFDQKG
ncbi:hypothetical protein DX116_07015 [Aeromicrobium endophyticum]|uniref:DUF3558 domain-containing protein n=2 Tax=Aeromicrobium endophyticum TaxID=2292704 RepID=A0A371PBK0_9ACTN|nr:hypothetical protein DX116_07015 [Aeromicrobium endophyticum]